MIKAYEEKPQVSFLNDMRETGERLAKYVDEFKALLVENGVFGEGWYDNLKKANQDPDFVARRNTIWKRILEAEGGKLTFGTVLAIIGAVLGSVGIAGAWGAFGLPLVLLLVPAGIWIGNELDGEGMTRRWVREVGSWFTGRPDSLPETPMRLTPDTNKSDLERLAAWQERMRAPVDSQSEK